MKKLFSLFLSVTIILNLAPYAIANGSEPDSDQNNDFHIEGEWYVAEFSESDQCEWPIKIDEDGTFHIYQFGQYGEDNIIYHDGEMYLAPGDTYAGKMIQPYEDVTIYYITESIDGYEEGVLYGIIVVNCDEEDVCYEFGAKPVFISTEKIIPYSDSNGTALEYQLIDGTLYLTDGMEYTRGKIELHGNDVFFCPQDTNPVIGSDSETDNTVYLFIRSSVIE